MGTIIDFEALLIDTHIVLEDLIGTIQVILFESHNRIHNGLFHHTAQEKDLVFYFLCFPAQ